MQKILLFFFFPICVYSQFPTSTHPAQYQGEELIVGKGNNEYLLLADGGVYRHKKGAANYDVLGNQTKANIKTAFGSLVKTRFNDISFNHPSKNSFFVRYKNAGKQHEVVWGDDKFKTPPEVLKVYQSFMGMIPVTMRY